MHPETVLKNPVGRVSRQQVVVFRWQMISSRFFGLIGEKCAMVFTSLSGHSGGICVVPGMEALTA